MTAPTATAQAIATALGEPNLRLIQRIVARLGPEAALAFLAEVLAVEAAGGLLTGDGTRRRTPGGVYFHLVRGRIAKHDRWRLWPADRPRPAVTWSWAERATYLPAALAEPGGAMTAKLILTGRPGRVVQAGGCVITTLQSAGPAATLPRGLPAPPAEPTTFVVYIAARQWRKVAAALEDADDSLIIEGVPVYDAQLPGLALLAQSVTTKGVQTARRQTQDPPAGAP